MSEKGKPGQSAKFAKKNEVADRRRRVAALALARMTLAEIRVAIEHQTGVTVGLSTLSRDLIATRADWRRQERVDIKLAQEQELAALASDEARLRGFLVKLAAGDHKARIGYQQAILDVMKLRSKILGTEAPTKIDARVDTTVSDRRLDLEGIGDEVQALATDLAAKVYAARAPSPLAITADAPPSTNGNGNGAAH